MKKMIDISKQKSTYQIESLKNEENYELWSICMFALLSKKGLVQYIKIIGFDYSAVIENKTAKNVIISKKIIFAWVLNNLSANYETLTIIIKFN
jgi:hypothetical protein